MDFIITHLDMIILVITSLVTIASAISAVTESPRDDAIVDKIKRVVDTIALNVGKAKR